MYRRARHLLGVIGIGFLCFFCHCMAPSLALAEEVSIEAEGKYLLAGDAEESPASAQDKARADALRHAVEQVCLYIESLSEARDGHLEKDIIRMIAEGMLKVQESSVSIEDASDGALLFRCCLLATVDSESVEEGIGDTREQ